MSSLRRSNLVGLTWSEVDLANRQITVIQKGDRIQTIEIDNEMMEILLRQLDIHPVFVFTYVAKQTYYNKRAERMIIHGQRYPMTVAGFTSWYKRIGKKLDLDIRVHDLRRTGATRMLRETGNLKAVQKHLGHADIKLTAKHYAHVSTGDMIPLQERTHAGTRRKRQELAALKAGRTQSVSDRVNHGIEGMVDERLALVNLIEKEADTDLIRRMLAVVDERQRNLKSGRQTTYAEVA
ncbi:tyrosine-type recombinase/integrase [Microvirga aerophila]|uniref:Tyr recombinase domain-containing protein n=1 Tax=Microvirga aerophila TaxID=670291 RepID=A0A512BX80_9HYPH|nr:site-specific integrase [Microvirga aerophila]GEO16559.1 hypothetical protein MAE02_42550 [Microvirga aerophila]